MPNKRSDRSIRFSRSAYRLTFRAVTTSTSTSDTPCRSSMAHLEVNWLRCSGRSLLDGLMSSIAATRSSAVASVVHADFILVEIRQVGFHRQRRFRRRPNGSGDAAVIGLRVECPRRGRGWCLERRDVDLHLRSEMDVADRPRTLGGATLRGAGQ